VELVKAIMNHALRDKTTGRFLKRAGVWVKQAGEVLLFEGLTARRIGYKASNPCGSSVRT
jgi:hypothetical protein